MENFLIVQCVELRGAQRSKKSAEIRSCQRYLRSSCTAAWPHATQLPSKAGAENERPVRGDNRTGQAIWALGVDGRSRRIQPMGRDYRSHIDKSQHPRRTFKTPGDFFNLAFGTIAAKPLRSTLFRGVYGRFVRRHRRRGVIQRPAHGSVIGGRVKRRRFFSRRLA